ncbi:MAG: hypothetical protein DME26_08160 [Verrucomicrobia bacterium]|nr:MAG: hypothetical protein DME26_08160 [Verrucomicrobiota bacterium]
MTIWAWDYEGHRMVNQLALAALPTNFPSFVATAAARERIAFLAGEPDRWRNSPELTLKHFNGPDHYLDLEDLEPLKLSATTLGPFRYEFMSQQAVVRHARPADFPAIDPEKNQDRTKQLVGFLPWTITEYYGKLKSGFSYLKVFEDGGTAEEVANARQNIIYIMGVMGHFVGDASQPLHTTKHYNGWLEPNPKHYPTNNTFHAWVDGGYIRQVGIQLSELNARPAQLLGSANPNGKPEDIFPVVMSFVLLQHQMVEPLYQLEKEGRLSATNIDPRGRAFIVRQLGAGAEMLADLWLTAWRHAPSDKYLQSQLVRRKLATQGAPKKP